MKIIVCLNQDIMSNVALNLLRPSLLEHEIEIFMSKGVGDQSKGIKEIYMLEQNLACDGFFPLFEQMGKPQKGSYYTFGQVEQYDNIKISYPKDVNSAGTIEYIKQFSPDLIISIRYGKIFKEEVISIPKHGIINLHSGILPDYKGILATFQAILHGEKNVGCTLHYIEDYGIDTGPIIGIHKFPVQINKPLIWHVNKLYDGGVEMIKSTLDKINHGQLIQCRPQDPSKGNYFSLPTEDDKNRFIDLGYSLCNKESYLEILSKYI